ncbi:MAG: hypothetical protein R3330_07565, partial [Saprospiraceae bacterium]|nr:hypothetical protein [Saprospiraceae bacterium]
MPLKTPLLLRKILHSASQYRIVWYFVLGILFPGIVMGILAFRGIRNDQALAEREQRQLALQEAAAILDSTEWLLDRRDEVFSAVIAEAAAGHVRIDTSFAGLVKQYPEVLAVYRITPSGVSISGGHLQYVPEQVRAINIPQKLLVSREPSSGWAYEYQQERFDRAATL